MSEIPKPTRKRGAAAFEEKRRIGLTLKPRYLDDGKSLRAIAEETGLSYGYVHSCLLAAGVAMRARGHNRGPGQVVSKLP